MAINPRIVHRNVITVASAILLNQPLFFRADRAFFRGGFRGAERLGRPLPEPPLPDALSVFVARAMGALILGGLAIGQPAIVAQAAFVRMHASQPCTTGRAVGP